MDLDEAVTITPLQINGRRWYVMIGWLANSFELYLYADDNVWKGKFSYNRLVTFSKNLNMTENDYFTSVKGCLSEQRKDYYYELKDGFFFWKQKLPNGLNQNKRHSTVLRGFVPIELITSPRTTCPDLIEVLIVINKQLKYKINGIQSQYKQIRSDYEKCLKDTKEFFDLKIEMEKALCSTFLSTIHDNKSELGSLDFSNTVCADTKLFINRLSKICPANDKN